MDRIPIHREYFPGLGLNSFHLILATYRGKKEPETISEVQCWAVQWSRIEFIWGQFSTEQCGVVQHKDFIIVRLSGYSVHFILGGANSSK